MEICNIICAKNGGGHGKSSRYISSCKKQTATKKEFLFLSKKRNKTSQICTSCFTQIKTNKVLQNSEACKSYKFKILYKNNPISIAVSQSEITLKNLGDLSLEMNVLSEKITLNEAEERTINVINQTV
jgi:trehalose/maltose hydrolase-like predicted phosphorylase